ncbi:hypothetical protein SUGI_0705680 [Cryptomeria japonica]|uniref:protein arginine N-methyltransferase PRMT10 n=1 Tax=Cryptomeria japonica TaxID=3369 RepID=UPI002414BE00|nr:protein arginine N-methyltransferase PRMT10 [Cryptomeria japonica]GLJ35076.1 hypothetical protein SUGI_0705680 [Cryptomeria japonica]
MSGTLIRAEQQQGLSSGRAGGGGVVDKGADFANYFCTYAFLYHQKEMLSDRVRMDAYYTAIFENKHHFEGKTVLDVGTGSGILAIWCAQAGARKVYAVEATKMADHARQLVAGNDMTHIVDVMIGSMEDIVLPEKVDVIISEWMGYFLLRESMFDSVICARDRWLKPDGVMYPSHARMWLAPIRSGQGEQKLLDYENAVTDWNNFIEDTNDFYGVDMSILTQPYCEEQKKYYLQTSLWNNLHPHQIIGTPAIVKKMDCLSATVDEISSVQSDYTIPFTLEQGRFSGFAGWFDVHFQGSASSPATRVVELTTAPSTDNPTHWGQQVFLLNPPTRVSRGDFLEGTFTMTRSKENHRLMDVQFQYKSTLSSGETSDPVTLNYCIE